MTLPYVPDKEGDLFIELDRRMTNLEGLIGRGLSHNDLIDTEDHKTFLKQDGSVPVTGTLDFGKTGRIANSTNRILDVDIYRGPIVLDVANNQLTLETDLVSGTVDHGGLLGLVDDDHTQYFLLVGRSGGQIAIGGINSGNDLTLKSTSHATKGSIFFGSSTGMIWDEGNKRLSFLSEENEVIINGTTFGETIAIHGVSDTVFQLGLHRHSNTAAVGASVDGQRSRGSEGAETIVQDGDNLLDVVALGFDGTDYIIAARLDIEVDGTPGNNDMPGRFVFRTTPDGGVSALERLRITRDGFVVFDKASTKGIKIDFTSPTFGWRDLLGETTTRNVGATKPSFETYNGAILQYRFGAGDLEHYDFHIPHDYVAGTDIYLHIHWSQISTTNTGGTLDFKYTAIYSKGHNQAAFTGTPITDTFTSADAGTIQYQQHITEAIISGASATAALFDRDDLEPDGVILMTLEMDSNDLTDSSGVTNPFIHYVDIHYQSTNLATKDKVPDFYT